MKVGIVTIAYNSGGTIANLFATGILDADLHDIKFYVFTHSAHAETVLTCRAGEDIYPMTLFDYRQNRGLAKSWNEGVLSCYEDGREIIIIANDDICFSAGDVDKIARKSVESSGNYMVSAAGWHEKCNEWRPSQGYSCFALNPIAWEKIGAFDENFWPAYFEDTDHHRRANLQGLVEENCPDTNVYHTGSMSVERDGPTILIHHQLRFQENMRYFLQKWGIVDIKDGYAHPFNNSKYGLYINPVDRENPYPEYRRTHG